jgi:hypothetical protein
MRKLPVAQKGHMGITEKSLKGSQGLFLKPTSDLLCLLGQVT